MCTLLAVTVGCGSAVAAPEPAEREFIATGPFVEAERGERIQLTSTLPPPVPVFDDPCAEMSWYRQQAGLPESFDRIGWRESRCLNRDDVRTFCCHGWWQLYVGLHVRDHRLGPLYAACGVFSADDVNSDTAEDKRRQACAAYALWSVVGDDAWAATR